MSAQISAECMECIESYQCAAKQSRAGDYDVRDEDGVFMFSVSAGIHLRDLLTMFHIWSFRRREGMNEGREDAFRQLRALIGAAEA